MKPFPGYNRGVNLGGWLSQCDHTFERYDTFITEENFADIANRKFDHVRVPIDYDLIQNEDRSFRLEGFKYIDFALSMCRKYKLNMILDLHRTLGYSFDEFHGEFGFFESEDYQNNFYLIWDELAKRYGGEDDILALELLNEVTKKEYGEIWNQISTECIKRIRTVAPNIKILIGGYYNNSLESVRDIAMPYDDNIVYTFHCYDPLLFTHQGAFWIRTMDTSFRCDYKMPYSKYDELSQKYLSQAYPSFDGFDMNDCPGTEYFEALLADAIEVAKERNVSLYCGEYGVIGLADKAEGAKWFNDFHAVMDKYLIGRAVWNYKEMDFEISKDF